jgi:site-specific DNA-methyltransferase (adenine-specific)
MSDHAFRVTHSSSVPSWRTEDALYAALDREFGFHLDAAATAANCRVRRPNVVRLPGGMPCYGAGPVYFGPDNRDHLLRDALILGDWHSHALGPIFCNPPSSRDEGMSLLPWLKKFHEQAQRGATIVAVIPHKTSSAYWRYVRQAVEIREIPHRVKYWLPADELEVINAARALMTPPKKPLKSGDSAGFDSAVVIYRPQPGVLPPATPRVVTWTYRPKPFTGAGVAAGRQERP